MACAFFTLPATKSGETWDGIPYGSLESTGTTFADSLAAVRMIFRMSGTVALTLTSAAGDITITDADAWEFAVDEVTPLTLAAGTYSWGIETTDSAGRVKTYFEGVLPVTADETP